MRKWTKGKLGGKELDRLIKDFYKEGLSGQENYYAGESGVCIPSEKELPDYTKHLQKREDISVYRGIYRGTAG